MSKQKRKNNVLLRGRAIPFAALWAGGTLAAGLASLLIATGVGGIVSIYARPFLARYPLLLILLMMTLPGLLHVQIVERVFKRSMRGWMFYTGVGAFLAVFLLLFFNPGTYWSLQTILNDAPLYFMVGTAAQTVWLWRHVKGSWFWPLAGILNVMIAFMQPLTLRVMPGNEILTLVWILLYGLVQGVAMHYLLSHPKDAEKAKVDFMSDEELDDARIQRLRDDAIPDSLWDIGDDQALQSKA